MKTENTPESWSRENREQALKQASKGSLEGRYPVRIDRGRLYIKRKCYEIFNTV